MARVVGGSAQTLDLVKRLENPCHLGAGLVEYVREMRNELEHDAPSQLPADLRGQALQPAEPFIDRFRVSHDRHEDPPLAEGGRHPDLRDRHRDRLGRMAAEAGATLTSVIVIATASAAWRRRRMSLTSRW